MSVAQQVSGNSNFTPNFRQYSSNALLSSQAINATFSDVLQYVNATGQSLGVDQLYAKQISLASTTQTFHFQTATLTDLFGNTIAMLRIRELIVQNLNTTLGQDLEIYKAASNGIAWLPPSTAPLYARSGTTTGSNGYGILRISDPASFGAGVGNVVSSTTDGLTIDAGSNTVKFNLIVLGCSVA